jgi:hypothetical protein
MLGCTKGHEYTSCLNSGQWTLSLSTNWLVGIFDPWIDENIRAERGGVPASVRTCTRTRLSQDYFHTSFSLISRVCGCPQLVLELDEETVDEKDVLADQAASESPLVCSSRMQSDGRKMMGEQRRWARALLVWTEEDPGVIIFYSAAGSGNACCSAAPPREAK